MHTICTHCHTPFTLCADAQDFVTRMQSTDLQLVMIECPHCQQTTGYTDNPKLTAPPDDGFRQPCLEPNCDGIVCHVFNETEDFYGCGECGDELYSKADLDADIARIIEKYPYRRAVYRWKNGWQSMPFEQEPADYRDLVETEPF